MPTLITTWGGSTSNSYLSASEATTMAGLYKLSTEIKPWDDATTSDVEVALIRATSDIDNTFTYLGKRREYQQQLEFPRQIPEMSFPFSTSNPDILTDDEVQRMMEERVKKATFEQAFYIIKNSAGEAEVQEMHRQRQNMGIRGYGESLGPVSESYSYGAPGDFITIAPKTWEHLQWYIEPPKLVRGDAFGTNLR